MTLSPRSLIKPAFMLCTAALSMVLMSGCASTRIVDSDVQSFAGTVPVITGASYRFERLPSQNADTTRDQVETMAAQALERVSLLRDDARARYSVEVTVDAGQRARNPYNNDRFMGGTSIFIGTGGLSWGIGTFANMERDWYRHSVRLLLREIASMQVVYEATAVYEGPWGDTLNLLPALLEATLRDYPHGSAGPHKVAVEIAPKAAEN